MVASPLLLGSLSVSLACGWWVQALHLVCLCVCVCEGVGLGWEGGREGRRDGDRGGREGPPVEECRARSGRTGRARRAAHASASSSSSNEPATATPPPPSPARRHPFAANPANRASERSGRPVGRMFHPACPLGPPLSSSRPTSGRPNDVGCPCVGWVHPAPPTPPSTRRRRRRRRRESSSPADGPAVGGSGVLVDWERTSE